MIERWQIPELNDAQRYEDQSAWVAGYRKAWSDAEMLLDAARQERREMTQGRSHHASFSESVAVWCLVLAMAGVVLALILN